MRVRGSLGLKLLSAESEKGSDVIETDSRATARVETAETLINVGLLVIAKAGAAAPREISVRPALRNDARRLPETKARVFIGLCSLRYRPIRSNRNEAGENGKALVEGPPGDVTLVPLNIHIRPEGGQQVLDDGDRKMYEAF